MAANKMIGDRKQREDRLSSLSDKILIDVLSRMPLCSAIMTCCLSLRWQRLWTNVTSIHLTHPYQERFIEFDADSNAILTRITWPSIHSFCFEIIERFPTPYSYTSSWVKNICDRNVRELKLILPNGNKFPYLIFEMQSLVSIALSISYWELPKNNYIINLPNLKNLRLHHCGLSNPEFLENLITACPSLEELSLRCGFLCSNNYYLRLSNQNLRRLSLSLDPNFRGIQAVISAPKLEYFRLYAAKSALISFDEKPILLHEANIEITRKESKSAASEFYKDICRVRVLSLDVSDLSNVSSSFPNVTRVTLNMKTCHNIHVVSSFLRKCYVLDVLTLKFLDIGSNDKKDSVLRFQRNLMFMLKLDKVKTLRQVIKRIEIQTYWRENVKPAKSFLELVEYLLSEAKGLEHFRVRILDDKDYKKVNVNRILRSEEKLCKLLYECPTVSKNCDVEFVGKLITMSRKDQRKISFSHQPYKLITMSRKDQ